MYNIIEEWRCIPDYPNYEISNLGNVKSLIANKILKSKIDSGYLRVCLCNDEGKRYHLIHRLVAQAFIPNLHNYPQVNHKDGNRKNNCVDNLEWCTAKYNIEYSLSKQVAQYDLSGNLIKVWKSLSEISRQLGFDKGNISNCCLGRNKNAYNFIWKYI